MKARTLLAAAALLAASTLALGALDWGGTLDNRSTLSYQSQASLLQEDKLALWLETPLPRGLTLTAQASYSFSLETRNAFDPLIVHILDVDLLKLEGRYPLSGERPALLGFTVGRFPLAEFSGWVLDATVDGGQLRYSNSRMNLSFALAFTGLQMAPVSPVSLSWADENERDPVATEPGLALRIGPPRLVQLLQVEFPELLGRQALRLAALVQEDLRSQDDLIQEGETVFSDRQGGRLHSGYLGAGLDGPLAAGLYYDACAWLATGRTLSYIGGAYQYAWMLSGLVGGSLRYYREDWLASRARVGLLLASGDADYTGSYFEGNTDGLAMTFVSMSDSALGLVFSPRVGNLAAVQAAWSIKPLPLLQTELSAWLFLRPTAGQISDVELLTDSPYVGTEIDLRANLRPFSDLGAALGLGLFLPGAACGDDRPQFRGRLEISFGF